MINNRLSILTAMFQVVLG